MTASLSTTTREPALMIGALSLRDRHPLPVEARRPDGLGVC